MKPLQSEGSSGKSIRDDLIERLFCTILDSGPLRVENSGILEIPQQVLVFPVQGRIRKGLVVG